MVLKCAQVAEISMSSANHCEIEVVTVSSYISLVTMLIYIYVKNGLVRLKKVLFS